MTFSITDFHNAIQENLENLFLKGVFHSDKMAVA